MKPRLLDLFCGAGGCSMGYSRAGFDVTGVDIAPMPRYPFTFIQGDALGYLAAHGSEYDAIHASPPCQHYSMMQRIHKNPEAHPDLVAPTRELLIASGKPYVIENVVGAPLHSALMLCGTMFGLKIIRHRVFECPWMPLLLLPECNHANVYDPWHGSGKTIGDFSDAMGIDWMPSGGGGKNNLSRPGSINMAVPPAYTEFIGMRLMQEVYT